MEGRFYRTPNLYEASFLLAKDFSLAGKERVGNKVIILFEDSEQIRKAALDYYNGANIRAKEYSDAYRTLKDYIFDK